jgi:AcrR family transcriptional regulator
MARNNRPFDIRNEIIAVAEEMICEFGYDNIPIEEITMNLGISRGTFYYYFRSKDEMLDALVLQLYDEISNGVNNILENSAQTSEEKLHSLFQYSWNMTFQKERLWDCINDDVNARVHIKFEKMIADLLVPSVTNIIKQGVDEGVFDVDDPTIAAIGILDPGPEYTTIMCKILEKILGAEQGVLSNCLTRDIHISGEGGDDT